MKIALAVHGRFHAFDLTRALLKRGHDITIFTNYPSWAVERFGIPGHCVQTFPVHGVLSRVGERISGWTGRSFESWTHPMFGRWVARQLRQESWDVIHAWTGVAQEIYADAAFADTLKIVMRGSAHILTQAAILAEEQTRLNHQIDQPSQWMVDREQREYALADRIVVLSTFARNSFLSEGIDKTKLRLLPLGTETKAFRPAPEVVEARRARILSGAPLRVLFVGGLCFRKGLVDIEQLINKEDSIRFQYRFVGPVWPEAITVVAAMAGKGTEFVSKRPQSELPSEYAWGDVFIFPTVEDGYAVVLAQASAAALPILTTTNCSGPDLIQEGRTGWVLPIRSPQAFLERLSWCDSHRQELAEMVTAAYMEFRTRDWSDVAVDFEQFCTDERRPFAGRHDSGLINAK